MITCRNLLIYFQPHAQKTVLTLFHFALKPGGGVGPLLLNVYDRLLERFMPLSFLVDDHGHLVDTFGGAEALLRMRPRRPTQNLLEMLDDDLRTAASGALHRVRKDAESVRFPGVPVPGREGRFSLVAEAIRDARGTLTHVLLSLADPVADNAQVLIPTFHDVPGPETGQDPQGEASAPGGLSREQVRALEDELSYTKEHLQSAIQEHETANEELQATNEELIASNEELQSTNEELHSVNEELYTVNAEYQKKNLELQELNNDIEHLLNGTDVATMFLDRFLCAPDRRHEIDDVIRQVRDGRPVERLETVRQRKGGTLVDVSVTFSPIRDQSGTVCGISAISRDITQLIAARQEIADRRGTHPAASAPSATPPARACWATTRQQRSSAGRCIRSSITRRRMSRRTRRSSHRFTRPCAIVTARTWTTRCCGVGQRGDRGATRSRSCRKASGAASSSLRCCRTRCGTRSRPS